MSGGSSGSYRVVYLRHVLDSFRQWLFRASELSLRPPLEAAMKNIHYRLTANPSGWGNPDTVYRHLGMQMRKASEWGIALTFGVDEMNHLVCVSRVRLLPNHPLTPVP